MQFIGTGDRILTENFNVGYLYTITFKTGIYINSACIGIGDNFVMFQRAEPDLLFTLNVDTADDVDTIVLYDSGGGTDDYDDLSNRPQINSHTLTGNMTGADLGLQDTISDLDTIRAGAAAGATAVQPADMTTALSAKQDTISDLDTIRAGAAAGATAVQPADMTTALAAKQDALTTAQLDAVNSGITSTDVAQIETNKNNISWNWISAKNKLKNVATTQTVGEAVFTVNEDKSITVYTTAETTASRSIQIASTTENINVNVGDLVSGLPNTDKNVSMQYGIGASGNIVTMEPPEEAHVVTVTGVLRYMSIFIRSGVNIPQSSPIIFKPMICSAEDWQKSHEYSPYAMSNLEITAWILAHS